MDNNFVYQLAKPEDVEQIVTLFELCLGTEGGAPTVGFWNWKHNQNPGGISPVILAWDGDKLIGIRAFMCFKFQNKALIYKAYRPVDTATHPDYQGRGIFKNLTLTLIEDLQQIEEKAFIFNTPNAQSKPGYLKMGWKEWGKPLIQVLPTFSFFGGNFKKHQTKLLQYDFSNIVVNKEDKLTVCKDADYYKWRYQDIALQQYGLLEINNYLIIYRQKKVKFLKEFRICDIIHKNSSCKTLPTFILIRLLFLFPPGFITFISQNQFLLSFKLKNKAPMVTYRKVKETDAAISFNSIDWNIGELELF